MLIQIACSSAREHTRALAPVTHAFRVQVCGYRLVNGYCRNDWVLGFVYRAGTLLRTVAGLRPITADDKVRAG